MNHHTRYFQDDDAVLLEPQGSASGPLMDFAARPRIEPSEDRFGHAAPRAQETFTISLNPLVAAASTLLCEAAWLKDSDACEDLQALNERLVVGVKRFEARALRNGGDSSQVMAARYVLCTVIDEAVVSTPWGTESEWSRMSLLSRFHNETFGGEKVFQLLDRLIRDPVKHLPMLELMYLCLSLGFEGKYRVQVRGIVELENIQDALYRQIRHLRGETSRALSPQWQGLGDQPRRPVRIVPAWALVLFALVCLAVMYSGFAWVLDEQRETILQPYHYHSAADATAQPPLQP